MKLHKSEIASVLTALLFIIAVCAHYFITASATGEITVAAVSLAPAYEDTSNTTQPSGQTDGLIDINTAVREQLMELPGIGEALSLRIIEFREENGRFEYIEDIMQVSGIGEKLFDSIADYITAGN